MDYFKVELIVVYGRKMAIIKINGLEKKVRLWCTQYFPLCAVWVQPHLGHYVYLCAPQFKKDAKILFWKRAAKLVEGLECLSWEECLRTLALSSSQRHQGSKML